MAETGACPAKEVLSSVLASQLHWPVRRANMNFTKLDLKTPLTTIFDTGITDLDRARQQNALPKPKAMSDQRSDTFRQLAQRLAQAEDQVRARTYATATAEVLRQATIYTREETAYVTDTKSKHARAQTLSKGLVNIAKTLATAWDDSLAGTMAPMVKELGDIKTEVHANATNAGAHVAFRENRLLTDDTKMKAALGDQKTKDLTRYYHQQRDPMIALTGDLKTYIVKIDEFLKRGQDCLQVATALSSQEKVKSKDAIKELQDLLAAVKTTVGNIIGSRAYNLKPMTEFVTACIKNANGVDAKAVTAAMQLEQSTPLKIKNWKTEQKTHRIKTDNANIRLKRLLSKKPELRLLMIEIEKEHKSGQTELEQLQTIYNAFHIKVGERKTALRIP
jgi:hypothetical protein